MAEPAVLTDLRARVDAALADHLDRTLPRLRGMHPALGVVADELASFTLRGGKRLRPAFLLVGYRAAGGEEVGAVMGAALAIELLHSSALLHDDVIDAAATRRGRPTAHVRFADQHRDARWTGDPDEYGRAVALLLGDVAFVHADEAFRSCAVPMEPMLAAFDLFITLREEVMAGQYLDLFAARSARTDRDLALTVASYKAGRYTVARPLQIGARLAGAPPELLDGLLRFGLPLGQAFQLRDDVLGVFGAEAVTGKTAVVDLTGGKRTVLVAETAERLAPDALRRFEALLAAGTLSSDDVAELQRMMRESGGLAATEQRVDRLVEDSLAALADLPLSGESAGILRELAHYVARRPG